VSRDGAHPVVTQEDLRRGAAHQLRGRLSMLEFDRRIVPTRGLDNGEQLGAVNLGPGCGMGGACSVACGDEVTVLRLRRMSRLVMCSGAAG
jgi:hypothetical protein